ncbi:MAG: T9SS type A sorting domain-containing protein, partial [candidate division WOR-3 bacterium]|nr:T9SS type A sorting domain-containing protein [candidate division WOR-3 bacterium]
GTMVCYSKTDTLTEREQIYQCHYGLPIPEQRVVDMDEDCEEPVYSPSGQYIAFQLDDTVSGFYQLCVTTASGGGGGGGMDGASGEPVGSADLSSEATAVTPNGDNAPNPRLGILSSKSAVESRSAISAGPGTSGSVASLGLVWQITYAAEDHCYPEWSPNGQWLCYERDDDSGYTQVWRVPAFGGTEEQLTFGDSDHLLPSYLNANEIVFILSPNVGYDVVGKVNVSTHQTAVVSNFQTDHDRPNPAWDGTSVVAEALDDSCNTQIVKIPIWVGSESWLTSGTSDIMEPDYSQDNRSVFAVRWTGITSQIVCVDALYGGYSSVTDSLAIRDNPDGRMDAGGLTSSAVYEREAWSPMDLLLDGGGKRRHGSGIYLSRFRRPKDGPQGVSLGILALDRAEPNPTTGRVRIHWTVPAEADVSLRVYNTAGQLVKVLADGRTKPGTYTSVWNGTDARGRRLANGIYFYTLDNGAKRISRKVVLTD